MKSKMYRLVFIGITATVIACGGNAGSENDSSAAVSPDTAATTSQTKTSGEWVSLFDGRTLGGWHGYNKTGEVKNWTVQDSALVCLGAAKDAHGGDLVTDKTYGNFELTWDWKVDKGSNSGVMYHVIEDAKYQAPYETGPEYQVIDDIGFPEKLEDWQKAGADYAMTPANNKKHLQQRAC